MNTIVNTSNSTPSVSKRKKTCTNSKSAYKHIPHREKPPHLVAKRNARERRRVQAVNSAFVQLRKCVPFENRSKRLSKVKTLQKAIEYIEDLTATLRTMDPGYEIDDRSGSSLSLEESSSCNTDLTPAGTTATTDGWDSKWGDEMRSPVVNGFPSPQSSCSTHVSSTFTPSDPTHIVPHTASFDAPQEWSLEAAAADPSSTGSCCQQDFHPIRHSLGVRLHQQNSAWLAQQQQLSWLTETPAANHFHSYPSSIISSSS